MGERVHALLPRGRLRRALRPRLDGPRVDRGLLGAQAALAALRRLRGRLRPPAPLRGRLGQAADVRHRVRARRRAGRHVALRRVASRDARQATPLSRGVAHRPACRVAPRPPGDSDAAATRNAATPVGRGNRGAAGTAGRGGRRHVRTRVRLGGVAGVEGGGRRRPATAGRHTAERRGNRAADDRDSLRLRRGRLCARGRRGGGGEGVAGAAVWGRRGRAEEGGAGLEDVLPGAEGGTRGGHAHLEV